MKKVSVIVPVYNAQDNIANAIDSLLKQTLDDIEIILINDGSKDNSLIVLKEYEKKYPHKIKVIDQENLGPGGARNTGLKIAKGEYIGFLDSDDTQNSKMYETMYRKAKTGNFDLVVCDVNAIYDKKTVTIKSGIDADHFNNEFIKKDMIFSYTVLWNKLIKKEIATSISFSNRLWYEDVEYLFKLFPLVNSIGTVKRRFCNYYQNDNSITYTYNKKIYDIVTVMNNLVDYYKKNKLYDQYKDEIEYSYVRYLYGTFIRRIAKTKNKTETARERRTERREEILSIQNASYGFFYTEYIIAPYHLSI